MVKDKLQIFIITYNRKRLLIRTLNSILSEQSPVKDYDITVIDNASTDGTSDVIKEFSEKFSNIKHLRHPYNIGGNANICRAFELAASCGKEYAWILCDDDVYDFSNWSEVEENINNKKDIICVSDYSFPSEADKTNPAYQIFQLTFVPASIFRTDAMSSSVLTNMYDNIYAMFQQTCLTAKVMNNNGSIHVLSKPIVHNGIHCKDRAENISLTRGYCKNSVSERREKTTWILGFAAVISLFKDKQLILDCFENAILYKDICDTWKIFYKTMCNEYFHFKYFNYFYEVFKYLKPERKRELILYISLIPFKRIQTALRVVCFMLRYR